MKEQPPSKEWFSTVVTCCTLEKLSPWENQISFVYSTNDVIFFDLKSAADTYTETSQLFSTQGGWCGGA